MLVVCESDVGDCNAKNLRSWRREVDEIDIVCPAALELRRQEHLKLRVATTSSLLLQLQQADFRTNSPTIMSMFKKLFKEVCATAAMVRRCLRGAADRKSSSSTVLISFKAGVKDVITLFHSPKNPSSIRVYTLLKQTAATAQSTATEDQASNHDQHAKVSRTEFEFRTSSCRIEKG